MNLSLDLFLKCQHIKSPSLFEFILGFSCYSLFSELAKQVNLMVHNHISLLFGFGMRTTFSYVNLESV